ncbi:hypothetical protein C478_04454 [Natrinema thermotolerans DSM 11552]|nr:hypothetical protein C478_04454 [Natrinema thermotolerans DSM 11552]
MDRRTIQLVVVAALVAVAGCAGGMGGQPATDSAGDDPSSVDDSSDGGMGTAAFYVSDEPNVIDDFEHLNVTITKVGFKKAGGSSDADDGNESGDETDDGNETDDETGGEESESDDDGAANETDADWEEQTEDDGDGEDDEKDGDEKEEEGDSEKDGDQKEEEGDGDEKDGGDDWVEYDVDERTVDLTELKGANASMIDEFELPAGDYEKVFIYVSDTEGVLTDGSTTRVKLPSSKLQLNKKFTIGNNESVDFVYDIAPHKAGGSGKYILKPVISQSGTGDDVEIRDIDKDDKKEDEEKRGNGGGNGGNGNGAPEANADD